MYSRPAQFSTWQWSNPTNPTSPRLSSNTFSLRTWAALGIATIATPTVTCADATAATTTVGQQPMKTRPRTAYRASVFSHLQCVQSCIMSRYVKICQASCRILLWCSLLPSNSLCQKQGQSHSDTTMSCVARGKNIFRLCPRHRNMISTYNFKQKTSLTVHIRALFSKISKSSSDPKDVTKTLRDLRRHSAGAP